VITVASGSDGLGPGSAGAQPSHVALLISYANSVDHELGTDDLTTCRELTDWLTEHGLLRRRTPATLADLALARELRDGLHEALVGNHDGTGDSRALESVAAQLPLQLSGGRGQPGLQPALGGIRGALTRLLIAVNSAVADDTWRRLKICSADDCAWAYFDATKNRSRAWCEWGCGNRIKTRNYRARKKAIR
jgi:predicted RNA-binding Zn ribbon-like protein